jgi:hypothetical protein
MNKFCQGEISVMLNNKNIIPIFYGESEQPISLQPISVSAKDAMVAGRSNFGFVEIQGDEDDK